MYIVSSKDTNNVGCIINTLSQITSENPIITISLNKENYTSKIIKKIKKFSISILSEKTSPNIISKFGFSSSQDTDKFLNTDYEEKYNLPIIKENSCGYLICDVIDIIDAETHEIFIARVTKADKTTDLTPMTYKYYREVIKGKAPKKAPTYVKEEKTIGESWKCEICGYIHEGPLPQDFICPICGASREVFQKQ